jgi:hypothetical protein
VEITTNPTLGIMHSLPEGRCRRKFKGFWRSRIHAASSELEKMEVGVNCLQLKNLTLLVVVLCRTSFLNSSYLRTFAEILSTVWTICWCHFWFDTCSGCWKWSHSVWNGFGVGKIHGDDLRDSSMLKTFGMSGRCLVLVKSVPMWCPGRSLQEAKLVFLLLCKLSTFK